MIPRELRTERLLLRQWRDEDAEPLAAIYAQPEYLEHMPALDLEGTRDADRAVPPPAGTRRASATGPSRIRRAGS